MVVARGWPPLVIIMPRGFEFACLLRLTHMLYVGFLSLQAEGKSVEAGHLYTPTLFCPWGLPFWPGRAPSAPMELLTLRSIGDRDLG